ncbi:AAA family ATPase [Cohnella fermenti]|uniref:ATPase AAA-type core domain-containing protein n=1 Tax=Cohnella fermenti TaxID=2565925 RepID=A0A4S4CEI7_9BACL|nr:AAA family ATPase [Cohnella fermenti]THF84415.1 hypothetical protein E6C55_00025 [Cohnella fermenti]
MVKVTIQDFKSIHNVEIELGSVNVMVGANGVGKSALLEAVGILSAAVSGEVGDESLLRRGVRLGTPELYKSSFSNGERLSNTLNVGVHLELDENIFDYRVHLQNPSKNPSPYWKYFSEQLERNGEKVFGRSRASRLQLYGIQDIDVIDEKGWLAFIQGIGPEKESPGDVRTFYEYLRHYSIFSPTTLVLRGLASDSTQREPLGLLGGRLPEVVADLLNNEKEEFGSLMMDELLELLDWVDAIKVGPPNKGNLSSSVSLGRQTIIFTDTFMRDNRNELTSYDASEGALYVLFLLSLAMHPKTPSIFSVDNFDQALNPRLARKLTKVFAEKVIAHNKRAIVTTHNPLVLDGLDLENDSIRLFTVNRDKRTGNTHVERIIIDENLRKLGKQGYTLSRLWLEGRLGGVPDL